MVKSLRVLHIVTRMERAGIETMLMNYYRHIDRDKLQFDFLTHGVQKGDYDDEILSMGGRIYYLPPVRYFIKYMAGLKTFFDRHPQYKIVHSHIDALSAFPLWMAKKAGVPMRIAHSHTNSFNKDWKLVLRYISKWLLPSAANQYWGCSKAAVKFMFGDKIYTGGAYTVLNNAIDSKRFAFRQDIRAAVRKELALDGSFAVGHVGHFNDSKNHGFLVDIFLEVYKKDKNSKLLLIGDGAGKPKVQQKAEKLGLGGAVIFLGKRSDVPELMQAMDVFLLPSRFEGLSVALVEAQAAGLGCVASADVIPRDSNMTGLVKYIPLTAHQEVWAEAVLGQRGAPRADSSSQIIRAGYDIEDAAAALSGFYLREQGGFK